jgi:hypothetical protein
MPFFKDSVSSSAGIAVISFDLPSTSRWPSASEAGRHQDEQDQLADHDVPFDPGHRVVSRSSSVGTFSIGRSLFSLSVG